MLSEQSQSDSALEIRVERFTATYRPNGTSSAYELLFIPTDGETPFVPPAAELSSCLRGWAGIVGEIDGPAIFARANWVAAAEVTFAYLVCAGRAGLNLRDAELLQQIVTLTRSLEASFGSAVRAQGGAGTEALERISAVASEIVAQGYATEPRS